MLQGKYLDFYHELTQQIDKKRIFHDPLHTLAFGTDASLYRLIPKIVIKAKDEKEVIFILGKAAIHGVPVTFRAAGTSLSGQSVTDSVLVMIGEGWKRFQILENGKKIRVQPGLTGGKINLLLAPYMRKIGPDPASINSATIGGIVSNNASGMSSGTAENAFNTIHSMKIILADGTLLDTGDQASRDDFARTHPGFIEDLLALAASVRDNEPLAEKIRHKFRLKNTTGYGLNALTDFSDPFQMIQHLMIGSEGTLGFISELNLNTVSDHPFRASSLMIFPDLEKACQAVSLLKSAPVAAVELIDRPGLRSVENEEEMPSFLRSLPQDASAILVETAADTKEDMDNHIRVILDTITAIPSVLPVTFTDVPAEYQEFWKIRKGLFPSVGAMRKKGTTVIIEDVAFPVEKLAAATLDLQKLLRKYNYHDAVIYGHALEGNLHFIFSQDFGIPEEIQRYDQLMRDVAELVVNKYDGSLKAEHGTGRNMAPFVEKEWGRDAYRVMEKIKELFDPGKLLNPGVILNSDPEIHLRNLKPIPVADDSIDKCIECGFCEPSCVSADLTLTPRQRIVVFREIKRLTASGEQPHLAASLIRDFSYPGNETCATDGLCAVSCPVKIDTGKLIKKLRSDKKDKVKKRAMWIADHMKGLTSMARGGLSFVSFFHSIFGNTLMQGIASGLRKASGNNIPLWNPYMPGGAKKIKTLNGSTPGNNRKMVYFPSCINRSMGVSKEYHEEKQLTEKMLQLLHKSGYEVIFPENMDNLCCGMAFLSKGFTEAGMKKSNELEAALLKASNNGKYPVLCDMSPCLYTMKENMGGSLKLYEPVEFITQYLLPYLSITPLDDEITVFPVCSMKKMGLEEKLYKLAGMCARKVVMPDTNCCGFAGDRGFSYPELNRHGLRNLKSQLPDHIRQGYSTSRTCEIGLSFNSGISYKSIVYLVDQVSRPKQEL